MLINNLFKKLTRNKFEVIYLFYFLLLGFIFLFIVPPFQKADEIGHFTKVLRLSYGITNCNKDRIDIETKYQILLNDPKISIIPFHYGSKFPTSLYKKPLFANSNELVKINTNLDVLCDLPIIPYIPQIIGLKTIQFFGFNHFIDFFAGRLAMFLVSIGFLITVLLKIKKPYIKYPVLITLGLPMSIHQLTSYSYDAVQILLFLTYFILIFSYDRSKYSLKKLIYITIIGALMLFSRKGIEPLIIGLPLILFGKTKKSKFIPILIGIILFVLFLINNFSLLNLANNNTIGRGDFGLQKQIIIQYPSYYAEVLSNTWNKLNPFYLKNLIGMYGWLDYESKPGLYFLVFTVLGFAIYKIYKSAKEKMQTLEIIYITGLLLTTYFYIQTIMYLTWTPVGAPMVEGVQGRYFIYLVPIILILLAQILNNKKLKYILGALLAFLVIRSISNDVYMRYYDYSLLYDSYPQYSEKILKQAKTVSLKKPVKTKLNMKEGRTLQAISIYLKKDKNPVVPYMYEIYKNNKVMRRGFISGGSINNGENIVAFRKIKIRDNQPYYLLIKELSHQSNPIFLYKISNNLLINPIFLL